MEITGRQSVMSKSMRVVDEETRNEVMLVERRPIKKPINIALSLRTLAGHVSPPFGFFSFFFTLTFFF